MSDNEQVRSHEVSSGDESSSEATKNGFSHDGEPVHRPRKDSTSSSSESESEDGPKMADDDSDESESVSKSASKSEDISEAAVSKSSSAYSGAEQPPQPKSRSVSVTSDKSVSVEEAPVPVERKVSVASDKSDRKISVASNKSDRKISVASDKSDRKISVASVTSDHNREEEEANDTDDDVQDEVEVDDEVKVEVKPEAEVIVVAAPIPLERKVSIPELTEAEVELSKRETVHMDERVAEMSSSRKSSVADEMTTSRKSSIMSESASEKVEVVVPPPVEMTSRKSSSASSADSVSSEDLIEPVEEVQEAKPATIIEEPPMVVVNNGTTNGRSTLSSTNYEIKVDEPSSSSDEEIEKLKDADQASQSPLNGRRSGGSGDVAKIYQKALNNNNNSNMTNNNIEKGERTKPTRDITQIYTQTLNKTNTPPASPKLGTPRNRPASDITKLYTGGLETRAKSPAPAEKLPSPRKHNMSTAVDKDAIRRAYDDVRSDTSDTEWAVFKFDESNRLSVGGTGKEFVDFKAKFGNEERGFGYIRIKTGDEMSKRAKFVLVTWVGPSVSVMKKAKMSTDKALLKDVIQNMSVELQLESHGEFNHDHFKMQVDKASGARYGTGVRDL